MPKGKYLNNYEKGQIDALLNLNYFVYNISQKVKRSKRVIYNYIRLGKSYGKLDKNKGRKSILNSREKRMIVKKIITNKRSLRQTQKEIDKKVSLSKIYRVLAKNDKIKHRKMKKQLYLTKKHKLLRKEFCKKHIYLDSQWSNTIFSDEKKFYLDGPDGYSYYWHYVDRKEEIYSKNQNSILNFKFFRRRWNYGMGCIWYKWCFEIKKDKEYY